MSAKRILYIEDDQAIAKVFNNQLTDEGYVVKICDNGEDGLNATLDFKPDMIITGILMPKVSGFDVIDILKRTPETNRARPLLPPPPARLRRPQLCDRRSRRWRGTPIPTG